MPDTKKKCGHLPNPPDDVDKQGKPYDSCFQCFEQDYEEHSQRLERMEKAYKDELKQQNDQFIEGMLKDGDDSTE